MQALQISQSFPKKQDLVSCVLCMFWCREQVERKKKPDNILESPMEGGDLLNM